MQKILLPQPVLGSELANLVVELETLRNGVLGITTEDNLFKQLKDLLNRLEILGSARIEGNNTTVLEYIEKRQLMEDNSGEKISESVQEILNIEEAVNYCEEYIKLGRKINKFFISDLHKIVVKGLSREGSQTPGSYRKINLHINKSEVELSDFSQIENDMEDLFTFVETEKNISIAMIKNAVAHHRYVIIHPFDNGNGRTARIFTYACLLRDGFSLVEKVINPTAVFCSDRNIYYDMLSEADKNTQAGMENWCKYVLAGLKEEFLKIKKLTNSDFVIENIISPTLEFSKSRNAISDREYLVLKEFLKDKELTTKNLEKVLPEMSKSRYSQLFKELKERRLILETNRARYALNFNGPLMRGLIYSLNRLGFLPVQDESTKNI